MAGNDDLIARLNGWADAIRRFDIAAAHTLNEGATAIHARIGADPTADRGEG